MQCPFSRGGTIVVMAAVLLGGCVSGGPPLNGDVRALSPEEIRLQQVETKVAELSRRLDGMEASRNTPQVGDDLRSLRGDIEQLRHDFEVAQQQDQARLQALEQHTSGATSVPDSVTASAPVAIAAPSPPVATVTAAVPATASSVPPGAAASVATAPSAAGQEEIAYKSNLALLQAGRYDEAIRGFRSMLDQYPQGSYADNAWYWLGQTYNVKGDYANSAQAYQALIQRFQKVLRDFPNSRAASMASSQLSQLH
jgi:TolA-binding protein